MTQLIFIRLLFKSFSKYSKGYIVLNIIQWLLEFTYFIILIKPENYRAKTRAILLS